MPYRGGKRRHYGSAFSLIELLVVTSIIVILMAIMLPALKRSIRQARQTVCAHHLKAIDLMMHIYRTESRGWLPHIPDEPFTDPDAPPRFWFDMLLSGQYLSDPAVLICPDDPYRTTLEQIARSASQSESAHFSSYGMSEVILASPGAYLAHVDRHQPQRPLDTMLLADMGPDLTSGLGGAYVPVISAPARNRGRLPWTDGAEYMTSPWLTQRHGVSINVLTMGGAVRSVRTTELMRQPIASFYPRCAAASCTFCELEEPHYSFAHSRTYWWTGPLPLP